MCTALTFESFGLRIEIEVFEPKLLPYILERLPPGWSPIKPNGLHRQYRIYGRGSGVAARYRLEVVGEGEHADFTLAHLLDILEGDIQLFVAEFAIPHLFVHAGVVGWQGRAILLPGSSFAGKSTLVTSLVLAGATYYSDEYAVLDAYGCVRPYPRRVSLREGPHGSARRLDLGHHGPNPPEVQLALPVGLVAFLRFSPETGWKVRQPSPAQSIMALCEHTVAIQRRPADTLTILGKVVTSAHIIQGTRGEATDAVEKLLQLAFLYDLGISGEDG